ncbi:MAG: hypothetical protein EOO89_01220 [Pedobacter sp.]|nr:MAG: hypothetical protein EOO89_01220 [Pedobacter sp.]
MLRNIFTRADKKKITIAEILKGTTAGRMQSAGYMQVIPLTSDIEDHYIAAPDSLKVSTTNYGSMRFENEGDLVTIVPAHAAYVVKQAAQDHAMSHAGLVGASTVKSYATAACVQQSQPGFIKADKYKMLILPFSLREKAYNIRHTASYQKLWEPISKFNSSLGVNAQGHLEYFLSRFEKELDLFVAEFEPVEKQVGAIILIDGKVMGIERAPNYNYWLSIWPTLIRECYGSLAIEYQKQNGDKKEANVSFPLEGEISNLEELKAAMQSAREKEEAFVKETIRGLITDEFNRESEERTSNYTLETLSNDQFFGQIVYESDNQINVVYASLVLRDKWDKKRAWHNASPFSI